MSFLPLTACVADDDASHPPAVRDIAGCAVDTEWRPELEHLVLADDDVSAACACVDDDCFADWVESTFGCGVCVDVECGHGGLTACVLEPTGDYRR